MAWTASMDWRRPRFWKEFLTVREAREWLVSKKSGHVSLTQLNPIDLILLEIISKGCWFKPSATTPSKWDTQFTHASFTLFPLSLSIHLSFVCSTKPFTLWRTVTYSSTVTALFATIGIMFSCVKDLPHSQVSETPFFSVQILTHCVLKVSRDFLLFSQTKNY